MGYKKSVSGMSYYFHNGWKFKSADTFPMNEAVKKCTDSAGRVFYDTDYDDEEWESVTLPHTFNDCDLFKGRIHDAGSTQKRTVAFYRNRFTVMPQYKGYKAIIEFEGIRQTCYLYINGNMAGYYEAGVAPFAFDLTPWIDYEGENVIAIATDNTATRNIPSCIAETPNVEGAVPGSFYMSQEQTVADENSGVGFIWNCNDFNPTLGGITRPVKMHFKREAYITLPIYSNLRTKGAYIYGKEYDTKNSTAVICAEVEIRNEGLSDLEGELEIVVYEHNGKEAARFKRSSLIKATGEIKNPLSITPKDAYRVEKLSNGKVKYIPLPEDEVAPTQTQSLDVTVVKMESDKTKLRLWSVEDPYLYRAEISFYCNGELYDIVSLETGFRKVGYDKDKGVLINDNPVWLRGYAQRASNEWAAIGIAPEWLKDYDAMLVRESNANHIRWMHVAASPADIRACDRHGVVCTQPAGDKECETFSRQWDHRVELMRDIIIYFRNNPSILFWEAGNNSISLEHMREMRLLKEELDPSGGRFMGCRTLNTEDVINESEYVGTMLNRHAARFSAEHGPITETEYLREEAPRRIWDDYTQPDFDYKNKWIGKGGRKQDGFDFYDLNAEDHAMAAAREYSEFFNDRIGGASKKDWYSACAALCWTDSAQHGRQAYSENGRMSGRVDPIRIKKQSFEVFRVMQSAVPMVKILGHWNYLPEDGINYRYEKKSFNGKFWEGTGEYDFRDAKNKTVYVVASYDIKSVELIINGESAGVCDKPLNSFIFPFEVIDITRSGEIVAKGTDYEGNITYDRIETVSEPSELRLRAMSAPGGLRADGADVMFVDVEVRDSEGRICPICDDRIDFELEGEGVFLGGYNSGRFDGHGREDSVIHKNHVYAECGVNRVFIRSTKNAGKIVLKARMQDISEAVMEIHSTECEKDSFTAAKPGVIYEDYQKEILPAEIIKSIPEADAIKYKAEEECWCKILVNGQEPDTQGVRSVNKNGSVWGAVLCILERLRTKWDTFEYEYNAQKEELTLKSGGRTVIARSGRTHLIADGEESLMDGEPYVTPEGKFVMEVNAIVPYIEGVSVQYDERINVLRICTEN